MASDWIKLRASLFSSPKLLRLARLLSQNREFRQWLTPGGAGSANGKILSDDALRLCCAACATRVWLAAREHGKFVDGDLFLPGLTISDLDGLAGAPGIGEAMAAVGWATEHSDPLAVSLPEFRKYNALTPAERMANCREGPDDDVAHVAQHARNNGATNSLIEREGETLVTKSLALALDAGALASISWQEVIAECREVFAAMKPLKQEDRALAIKAVVLSKLAFDRDWLWQSIKRAKRKPEHAKYRYLHGALAGKSKDAGQDFNALLLQIVIPEQLIRNPERKELPNAS